MAEYKGAVCFVGQTHEAADGTMLEGGWHYSVKEDEAGGEHPDQKLFSDGNGGYRLAKDGDQSHAEQFPGGLKLVAVDGQLGDVRTPEEFEAAHRHLDELEQRLKDEGVHDQETAHILTTQQEIDVMRGWLKKGQT
jgi:hypothetical protein